MCEADRRNGKMKCRKRGVEFGLGESRRCDTVGRGNESVMNIDANVARVSCPWNDNCRQDVGAQQSSSRCRCFRRVVRYSALVGGIGYGILHRRTLQAKADAKAAHAEYKHKEQLIQKAKEAYKNKLVAKQSDSGSEYHAQKPGKNSRHGSRKPSVRLGKVPDQARAGQQVKELFIYHRSCRKLKRKDTRIFMMLVRRVRLPEAT
ncbi:hypothetical protein PHSY_005258 [Pseudozyma hubeiensis SY62]|uniref:Uncharacterized protein n=1 Tax=Pseudozyma hubeiensis (strain SY62) TaxID=1305764 RepID=R9P8T6_PSEHS|nr:hypothetical protein PHSY_005258 [Pseudozyma hubeiensis SY62]GAC97672.1 hypothetical protein PHSY_005258 [Pseudozyma hubeiensis SY62]